MEQDGPVTLAQSLSSRAVELCTGKSWRTRSPLAPFISTLLAAPLWRGDCLRGTATDPQEPLKPSLSPSERGAAASRHHQHPPRIAPPGQHDTRELGDTDRAGSDCWTRESADGLCEVLRVWRGRAGRRGGRGVFKARVRRGRRERGPRHAVRARCILFQYEQGGLLVDQRELTFVPSLVPFDRALSLVCDSTRHADCRPPRRRSYSPPLPPNDRHSRYDPLPSGSNGPLLRLLDSPLSDLPPPRPSRRSLSPPLYPSHGSSSGLPPQRLGGRRDQGWGDRKSRMSREAGPSSSSASKFVDEWDPSYDREPPYERSRRRSASPDDRDPDFAYRSRRERDYRRDRDYERERDPYPPGSSSRSSAGRSNAPWEPPVPRGNGWAGPPTKGSSSSGFQIPYRSRGNKRSREDDEDDVRDRDRELDDESFDGRDGWRSRRSSPERERERIWDRDLDRRTTMLGGYDRAPPSARGDGQRVVSESQGCVLLLCARLASSC